MEMPPKEPLMYRLFEIVQNYGYAYKAVLNEKFGDGIMSAISFSTTVDREEDDKGTWVKITLRGKVSTYHVEKMLVSDVMLTTVISGSHTRASRWSSKRVADLYIVMIPRQNEVGQHKQAQSPGS